MDATKKTAVKKLPAKPAKAVARQPKKAAKQPKAVITKAGKPDRRGTPKGKAVAVGRNGGRIGNPPFVVTDELRKIVETHAACGTPQWLIALETKISETTLKEKFRYELNTGLLRLNARIGSLIAKQALAGDKPSQSLWMKTRGGWSDKLLLATPPGQPIELTAAPPRNPDLKSLSDDEVLAYRRIQAKLEGIGDDRQL